MLPAKLPSTVRKGLLVESTTDSAPVFRRESKSHCANLWMLRGRTAATSARTSMGESTTRAHEHRCLAKIAVPGNALPAGSRQRCQRSRKSRGHRNIRKRTAFRQRVWPRRSNSVRWLFSRFMAAESAEGLALAAGRASVLSGGGLWIGGA